MGSEGTKAWYKGCQAGTEMVFEFLEEMVKVRDIDILKEEFEGWCNADEVKLPNGDIVKKY